MKASVAGAVLAAAFFPGCLAEGPIIERVVNGASYADPYAPGGYLAPGSIAVIFGKNLAPTTMGAPGVPLPFELGTVRVTVKDKPAPVFSVSPERVIIQIPTSIDRPGALGYIGQQIDHLRLLVADSASAEHPVGLLTRGLGIFTQDASGCGPAVITQYDRDGTMRLHDPEHSLQPGDWFTVYATGLGTMTLFVFPEDGHPATSFDPRLAGEGARRILLGDHKIQFPANYSGKALGLVGVDQINLRVPDHIPEGCALPFRLVAGDIPTQPVPLSIRVGGGACERRPVTLGAIEWRHFETNRETTGDEVILRFNSKEGNMLPLLAPEGQDTLWPGPNCPGFDAVSLDVGAIRLRGVYGGISELSTPLPGEGEFVVTLPADSVGMGEVSVEGLGGADVGPFGSATKIPPPIKVETQFPVGTHLSCFRPIEVRWSGGDQNSVVLAWLETYQPYMNQAPARGIGAPVPATDGSVLFRVLQIPFPPYGITPLYCPADAQLTIRQMPNPDKMTMFDAAGLSQPGRHMWSYEWRFEGLRMGQ